MFKLLLFFAALAAISTSSRARKIVVCHSSEAGGFCLPENTSLLGFPLWGLEGKTMTEKMLAGESLAGKMLVGKTMPENVLAGKMIRGKALSKKMLEGKMLAGKVLAPGIRIKNRRLEDDGREKRRGPKNPRRGPKDGRIRILRMPKGGRENK